MLVSEYSYSRVSSYLIDANGLPISASRQDFDVNVPGLEGATIDPVTGDFLFTTFGSTGHLIEIQGFAAWAVPSSAPEPAGYGLIGASLAGLSLMMRQRRRGRG